VLKVENVPVLVVVVTDAAALPWLLDVDVMLDV
jgi:hypothetical protein